jgi:hypothetical protein
VLTRKVTALKFDSLTLASIRTSCEGLTMYNISRFAQLHDELRIHFDECEVSEIAAAIINMNVWTRLMLAQGAIPIGATTRDAVGPSR